MEAMDMCFCVLILSGAFALLSLGVLLLRTSTTIKLAGQLVVRIQATMDKVDKILDDVTYKLELFNSPIESVARIFDPNRPKFNPIKTIINLVKNKGE